MANIGLSNAIYKVEGALTSSSQNISDGMERISTGKTTSVSADHAVFSALSNTFMLDLVGMKSSLKSIGLMKGYLSTAISSLDQITVMNRKLMDLAILGANATNTDDESDAIDLEAEALADELYRIAADANFKDKAIFDTVARTEYLSLGGRGESYGVTFGTVDVTGIYNPITETLIVKPSDGLTDTDGDGTVNTDAMTSEIQSLQEEINTLRVELSSHLTALDAAFDNTTDLMVNYNLGYEAISQVNFSSETAYLAKNQILQNAAMAMLAQASESQTGLLKLIE